MFGTIFSSTYRNLETQGVHHDRDGDDDDDEYDDDLEEDDYDLEEDDDDDDDDDLKEDDDDETCQGEPQFQFDPNQLQHQPD